MWSCQALTHGSHRNQDVLPRANVLVVGTISVEVGGTIHQPGGIEHHSVSQEGADTQAVYKSLTPAIPGHQRGQDEAHQEEAGLVVPTWRDHTLSLEKPLLHLPEVSTPTLYRASFHPTTVGMGEEQGQKPSGESGVDDLLNKRPYIIF